MGHVTGAVSLARALLALSRGRSTGVLTVCAPYDVFRIAIVQGVPRAAVGKRQSATLGDVLLRAGDLDTAAHLRALETFQSVELVGGWLVREGLASRPAVEHALRVQLRARIVDAFRMHGLDYRFAAGAADIGVPWIAEPISTADLVLSALRQLARRSDIARLSITLRRATLTLSPLGRALLTGAALWPDEAAMVPLLERGVELYTLREVTACSDRALGMLCVLVWLSAVVTHDVPRTRYQLLLRKERQLRDNASPADLLDLPRGAHERDARRALRRLARALHPDALGPEVPEFLRLRSTELMTALGRAEHDVRASSARRRAP